MHFIILPPVTLFLTACLMAVLDALYPLKVLWEAPASYLGLVPLAAGVAIASWHAKLFKRIGANIQTFGEPTALTREGLFGRTRNPMYLGFVLALAGLFVVLGSLSPLAGVLWYAAMVNWWYIPFEEKSMLRRFGNEYLSYCKEVRRWI
jgi:protein-S-isoprenylcysteine O-methyltransferase Ste14